VVVPALAGIGAVPQSRASAASLTMRCGLSPGGHQRLRGGLGSDSGDGTGRRRGLGDQVGHLFVGFGDFTVKCLHPPGQPAEHDLRGGGRLTDPGDVARSRAQWPTRAPRFDPAIGARSPSGAPTGTECIWLIAALRAFIAIALVVRSSRIASTGPRRSRRWGRTCRAGAGP
jgi:hypothetical protein